MRKIYILLTRLPDKGSFWLEFLWGMRYSHASIGLEEDMNTFYSFITKGFIVESITRYVKPNRTPFPCQLYELEVSNEVYGRVKAVIHYFTERRKLYKYARVGVVFGLFCIPYKQSRFHYFCTEFVAEVLQKSGAAKIRKSCGRCFAKDLKRLSGMNLVFQGNMQTMVHHFRLAEKSIAPSI